MEALIFDFDGLILDTEWPAYVTVAAAFEAHGVEMPLDEWQQRIGRGDNDPWVDVLAARADIADADAIETARRVAKNDMTDASGPMPGVVALLAAGRASGLPMAVASSSPLEWVGRHLERLDLIDHFVAVRTRDDVERAKPWPDVFLAAADALAVDPASIAVFEDSVHGVTAAKAAGMFCVAVPNRITAGGDFSHADRVVTSLTEIDLASLWSR